MVSRMALVLWILEAKMVLWLYEQPHTSLLWEHPRMQQFLSKIRVWRAHMYMGSYGAASPKPTFLWRPSPLVSRFSLPLPQREWESMVTKTQLPDGRTQVSGNQLLKGSQTYPKEFGYATLRVWRSCPKRTSHHPKNPSVENNVNIWQPKDMWEDANLTDVFQCLSLGTIQ